MALTLEKDILKKSLYHAVFVVLFTTLALALLLIYSKKDKFYPAMPFIAVGCFVGYLVTLII